MSTNEIMKDRIRKLTERQAKIALLWYIDNGYPRKDENIFTALDIAESYKGE